MRVPVPKNRLVALTLFGVLLTGLVSVTLAAPGMLSGDDGGSNAPTAHASDAPAPNQNYTVAVQQSGGRGGEYEEHEGGEREGGEHEDGEREGYGE